jgi:NADP-dependent 3-hydroxy acid dehydrogenase YdfG
MNKLLKDKVAIVAGISKPVMVSIVRSLLLENATVIVPSKSAQEITMLKECIVDIDTQKLVTLLTDYLDYNKAFELAESVTEAFGKIDLAVICFDTPVAGCVLTETNIIDWEKMVDRNITAFFITARVALANMKENKQGMFISISHSLGTENNSSSALAELSSGMQIEMAKMFCEEVKGYNIKCHHLMATHFSNPSMLSSSTVEKNGIVDNNIGNFVIKLFKRGAEEAGGLFQKVSVNAVSNNTFVIQKSSNSNDMKENDCGIK